MSRARQVVMRRTILFVLGIGIAVGAGTSFAFATESPAHFTIATFSIDVTPPMGHALMGGGIAPASHVLDPLLARGFILTGAGKPIALVAIDWCEIRNDAYDRWRTVLAQAAETSPERVLVACLHQHDAPLADLRAQRLLDEHGLERALCDSAFHERTVQRVASAIRKAGERRRKITAYGIGQARVEQVASNRRVVADDGSVSFVRGSATPSAKIRAQPAGEIDPWLKTISFWDGDQPLVAMSCYATHPMSYYGRGEVSADFVGLARANRQRAAPDVFQIYLTGASGDVTAGKYNDGATQNRPVLAERIEDAMTQAWQATKRFPLETIDLEITPLRLPARDTGDFTVDAMRRTLADESAPTFIRIKAAMGLSWHERVAADLPIDISVLSFGRAKIVLLPAESFVGYQLLAQRLGGDGFVMSIGYGECGPGYIPTAQGTRDGFINAHDWCWVAPTAPAVYEQALQQALRGDK